MSHIDMRIASRSSTTRIFMSLFIAALRLSTVISLHISAHVTIRPKPLHVGVLLRYRSILSLACKKRK